ncbi:hypothetical protein [Brevundimonas variabilis]|uniref:Uncharacterized protein n=1 Tax=Brevundimonas variabilis TaxID=74312 RepID=A0A7W9FEA1_9CAUL|nr:hypothetical protein [Brevundimonas variabilis]MBB5746276.1 hypothetical protein [Brevundimonas variabilis]
MFVGLAVLAFAFQELERERLVSHDIYCAAVSIVVTEEIQSRPVPDPAAEAGMMAMTLFFLGRVGGALPNQDAADSVITMAQGIERETLAASDIADCGRYFGNQVQSLMQQAQAQGRPLK